jgi:hypothetical protein
VVSDTLALLLKRGIWDCSIRQDGLVITIDGAGPSTGTPIILN